MKLSPCLLGFGFLGASFWASLAYEDKTKFKAFEDTLDNDQKEVYYRIKKERMTLYLTGLAIGTALAIAFLFLNPVKSLLATICLFMLIAWSFTYFYYTLMPKTEFMLEYLTSSDQIEKWVDVYRDMQVRYVGGFAFGALAYALLCYGVFKCDGDQFMINSPMNNLISF